MSFTVLPAAASFPRAADETPISDEPRAREETPRADRKPEKKVEKSEKPEEATPDDSAAPASPSFDSLLAGLLNLAAPVQTEATTPETGVEQPAVTTTASVTETSQVKVAPALVTAAESEAAAA